MLPVNYNIPKISDISAAMHNKNITKYVGYVINITLALQMDCVL
jgi:hypothetical protein